MGEELATSNGCVGCHSIDGSTLVGPTWQGLYGSEVELESGETVTADEAYITESIREPAAQLHAGFGNLMPPFDLDDEQIANIIAYIQTLE
ncbi:MAG TPA: cytochrome c [Thermomicrobiales bacterium]|nr:cytochrome c [Thermomicrobiales bacterium]